MMSSAIDPTTRTGRYLRRWEALKAERAPWLESWRDISRAILPRRGRFLDAERDRGDQGVRRIINNAATIAHRTLTAGLMSGITSPARPWFRLDVGRPGQAEDGAVKVFLSDTEDLLQEVFAKSNTYNALHQIYEELGAYGNAAAIIYDDYDAVIRWEVLTAGQYCVAVNKKGEVDTLYRAMSMTIEQIVDEFVRSAPGVYDWSVVSDRIHTAWDNKRVDETVQVLQAIEPNRDAKRGSPLARDKAWVSVWVEIGGAADVYLRETGFDEFPVVAPRWDVIDGPYGRSPAMDALGDTDQLQSQEIKKSVALEKMVDPPLGVNSSMKGRIINTAPGGVTYIDPSGGNEAPVGPLYNVNVPFGDLRVDMEAGQKRIRDAFYADLWLMIANDERSGITATEIAARKEEKLLMLGPVLERLHHELLDPTITRTYAICRRAGILPPVPDAIGGHELEVQYISMLAQAQRAVAVQSIERLSGFVGNLAAAAPEVLDKIDFGQAVDEYATAIGAPVRMVRTDDQVAKIRDARAQQAQQQQDAQNAAALVQGAQTLSQTDTTRKSALTDILGGITGTI